MLIPDMYAKDVFSINYEKLKKLGIKTLLIDLDNTLKEIGGKNPRDDVKEQMNKISKDFRLVLFSNNISPKRVKFYAEYFGMEYIVKAGKPGLKGFEKSLNFVNSKKELCIIGDQFFTDVKGGEIFGIMTILVDPLGKKDEFFTWFNRFKEKRLIKQFEKQNLFEKGKYYD